MARARVVDYDYYQFVKLMRQATDAGARIDKGQPRWAEYIRTHGINEVAATAIARQKFEVAVPVILAEGKDTDGLYFYSTNEEGCVRLVMAESS
ncbi:MAG TPA: hypothetical protein VMC02_00720 [Steroidobacteraceae bacterium]|nr:hypothetical protein [Steroidobacteraceae bacterium]